MGSAYSVIVPEVVILPIFSVPPSVNHRLLSGPVTIPSGQLSEGNENSVMGPSARTTTLLLAVAEPPPFVAVTTAVSV